MIESVFEYGMLKLCFYAPTPRWFITINSFQLLQLAVQMQMPKKINK